MVVDPVRLARQELCFNRWLGGKENGTNKVGVGIVTAVTGFGKTFIAILAIRQMNKRRPDRDVIVVVPTTKLLSDWKGYNTLDDNNKKVWVQGHIEKHNLLNVQVFVVNTFVTYKDWKTDFLILDECHHYANEESTYFSTILQITKYQFILALSATLSNKQQEFFARYNIPLVDSINDAEAQANGYVAPSIVYNLGIALSEDDQKFNKEINEDFKFYFSKFQHQFDLVKACNAKKGIEIGIRLSDGKWLGKRKPEDWIKELGRVNNYDGQPRHPFSPENISKNAAQCMNLMSKRKHMWQNFPSKLIVATKILKRFPLKTICFSETSAFADKLVSLLGDIAMAYHTNLSTVAIKDGNIVEIVDVEHKKVLKSDGYTIYGVKKRKQLALTKFTDPLDIVRVLSTVRALDEGVDIPTIECVIQLAYSSTTRQNTQRNGRAGRIDYTNPDKKALIINLYMRGTQEERWLKQKQMDSGVSAIWVDSIEEINPTMKLNLSTPQRTNEVKIKKFDIELGVSRSDS